MGQVRDEGIRVTAKYAAHPGIPGSFWETALNNVLVKIDGNIPLFTTQFPAATSVNNIYPAIDNLDWTTSFWTGMLWLAYEMTGDSKYRRVAEGHLASFQRRITERIATDTHDLGFLYTLSCVAGYKLSGNNDQEAKATAVKAAQLLTTRYCEKAGIIQAWGDLEDPQQQGRMIIDCYLNLPLLYWAAQVTGDSRYYEVAYTHAKQAAKYLIRSDASSFHTFFMDVETGEPRFGKTVQGYADDSCWARGQAWGIYGLALSYLYTNDWSLMELAQKMANYFLNRLPEDDVCYWDLIFTAGNEERDSSAAAIAACGLLELSKHLPLSNGNKRIYEHAALRIIRSLAENYSTAQTQSNGLLLHSVYNKKANRGVDECSTWGDYFYFETLVRIMKDWQLYW